MDKRLALIVAGSIIGITILCLTVIFPFIYKQLHPSVPPSIMEPTETRRSIVEIQATEKAITPAINNKTAPKKSISDMEPTETKRPSVEIQATEKAITPDINSKTAPKESKPEKSQRVIPKYILDSGQKIRGTSGK